MIYNGYAEDGIITLFHTKDGKMKKEVVKFKPSLYFESDRDERYKSIYGKNLKRREYSDIYSYNSGIFKARSSKVKYYGDIDPLYQYIINRFNRKVIEIDDKIQIYNYDIEAFSLSTDEFMKPEESKAPVQTITINEVHNGKYYVFGYEDYEVKDLVRENKKGEKYIIKKEDIIYEKFSSEVKLLKGFIKFLKHKNVQILTGYNILFYDNQYIFNRLKRLGIESDFVDSCKETRDGVEFGRIQSLDYQVLYKKFTQNELPKYKLDYVSEVELGFKKIDFGYGGSFRKAYKGDFQKFIDYNIVDTMLVKLLEEKLKYIRLIFTMCNRFRCLPSDVLSLTKYWDTYLYAYNLERNQIVCGNTPSFKTQYIGGYVKQPVLGLSDWSTLYDIESSYPTNNRRHNISPEMIIDYDKLPDDLFEVVNKLLFLSCKKIYDKYKNTYKTKSGSKSIIAPDKPIPDNKFHILYLRANEDSNLLANITYPHFFVIEHDDLDHSEIENCKKIDYNKYLYYGTSKKDIENKCRKDFKDYNQLNVLNHVHVTKWLVNYFIEDISRFEKFALMLKKYKLIITCNLQFFKKTKDLGILPKTQEIIFFDRKKAKKAEGYDESMSMICQHFIKNNTKVDKEKFNDLGMKNLPKEYRYTLIKTLKTKDIDKINRLSNKYKALKVVDNINNLALKEAINGAYGATANEGFRYNDVRLCESTTSCGQLMARGVARYIEQKGLIKWTYMDTDSCGKDTIINTNKGEIRIEDLWNMSIDKVEYKDERFFAELPETSCLSYNEDKKEIERKNIRYIMKHKVKKRMFKIKFKGKETLITEDHSIIIDRNGECLSIKPKDIKKGDKLITL